MFSRQTCLKRIAWTLATCLLYWALPARADQLAVIVDTSKSMISNDPDQAGLLATLMLADLLDPSSDELIALPFDPAQTSASHVAAAPVLRRSDHSPDQSGTNAFIADLQANIVYDGKATFFAPAILQAIGEMSKTSASHENRLIILLTDGDSNDARGEVAQFDSKIAKQLRDSGIQIFVVGLGSAPATQPQVTQYFRSRRLGGYEAARKASDLVPAFASILGQATQRQLERQTLTRRGKWTLQVDPSFARTDWVVMPTRPGLIKPSAVTVLDQTATSWTAAASAHDVTGEVSAVHVTGRKGKTRSYRRIRIEAPGQGIWTLQANETIELLALHQRAYEVDAVARVGTTIVPTGKTVRIPVGYPVCIEGGVQSQPSSRAPSVPVTSPGVLSRLELYLNMKERSTGNTAGSAPRRLDDDGVMPHDATAGDGRFGKCWTPTSADAGRTYDAVVDLQDKSSKAAVARAVRSSIEVIPAMVFDLQPNPVVFKGGAPMATSETVCETFILGPASAYFRESTPGTWVPKADVLVELGHRTTTGWAEGPPSGQPTSHITVTLDGSQASPLPTLAGGTTLGWGVTWEITTPEHEVCVTLGRRRVGGAPTVPVELRVTPRDQTYANYSIEGGTTLQLDTEEPSLWEAYGAAMVVGGGALVLLIVWWRSKRPPPLPVGLAIQKNIDAAGLPREGGGMSVSQHPEACKELGVVVDRTDLASPLRAGDGVCLRTTAGDWADVPPGRALQAGTLYRSASGQLFRIIWGD